MSRRRMAYEDGVFGDPANAMGCPGCQSDMSWATLRDGRQVERVLFRCPPGQHPKVFEVRCRVCNHVVVMYHRDDRPHVFHEHRAHEANREVRDDMEEWTDRKPR